MTELSPEAKKLLRIAREDFSPADPRVTAVRSALQARLQLARGNGSGTAGGIGGGASAGASLAARLFGIGVVAGTLAVGVMVMVGRDAVPAARSSAQPTLVAAPGAASIAVPRVVQATRAAAARAAVRTAPLPTTRQLPRAAARAGEARSATGSARVRSATRDGAAATATAAVQAPSADATDATDATDTRAAAAPLATAAERAKPGAAQAPGDAPVDDALAREIALMTRAHAALAHGDPRAALRWADEHAALFANGTMRQERLATRALALCALGRRDEALAAKRELERVAPRSPHLIGIRTLCATPAASSEAR